VAPQVHRRPWAGCLSALQLISPGLILGPENVLLISAGLLVGTMASASSRTHVMAKSPLTNAGVGQHGRVLCPEMRWAGFDQLVIRGRADKPVSLIHDGAIEIRSAANVWGSGVYDSQDIIAGSSMTSRPRYCASGQPGKPGALRQRHDRTQERGRSHGLGAVMGSRI
jgi:aldehyde:ferredoxin oxidoreductase